MDSDTPVRNAISVEQAEEKDPIIVIATVEEIWTDLDVYCDGFCLECDGGCTA
jgi:hypothetical protein